MALGAETLAKLRKFDTPTISNVIELFEVVERNRGYMDSRIKANFDLPPMVGFATTACFRSDAPPLEGNVYATLDQQVEQFAQLPGPAVVVFQDLDDPPVAATFGEVMCSTYKAFGSVGLITSGAGPISSRSARSIIQSSPARRFARTAIAICFQLARRCAWEAWSFGRATCCMVMSTA